MATLNKINLTFEISAPRADLLDDEATQVVLNTLGTEWTVTKLDFSDVNGVQYPPGQWTWTTTVTAVAEHV